MILVLDNHDSGMKYVLTFSLDRDVLARWPE